MDGIRSAISKDIDNQACVDDLAQHIALGLSKELVIEVVDGYRLAREPEDLKIGNAEAERLDRELLKGVGFSLVRSLESETDSGA